MAQREKKGAFDTPVTALAAVARHSPDKDAFVFPEGTLSFGEWNDRSKALAKALLDTGFTPGDNIALLAQNSIHWPIVQLAVAKAGMVLVPLNTYYKLEDLTYALAHSQARAVFFTPAFRTNNYLELVREAGKQSEDLRSKIVIGGATDGWLNITKPLPSGGASSTALPTVPSEGEAADIY